MIQKAGFNSVNKSPEFFNLMVWGDYTSLTGQTELLRYEEQDDCSVFNCQAKTRKRKFFFSSADPERMDQVIRFLQENSCIHTSSNGDSREQKKFADKM